MKQEARQILFLTLEQDQVSYSSHMTLEQEQGRYSRHITLEQEQGIYTTVVVRLWNRSKADTVAYDSGIGARQKQ